MALFGSKIFSAILFLAATSLAMSGCRFSKDPEKPKDGNNTVVVNQTPSDENTLVASDISVEVKSKEIYDMNKYFVRVTWKPGKEGRFKLYLAGKEIEPLAEIDTNTKETFRDFAPVRRR